MKLKCVPGRLTYQIHAMAGLYFKTRFQLSALARRAGERAGVGGFPSLARFEVALALSCSRIRQNSVRRVKRRTPEFWRIRLQESASATSKRASKNRRSPSLARRAGADSVLRGVLGKMIITLVRQRNVPHDWIAEYPASAVIVLVVIHHRPADLCGCQIPGGLHDALGDLIG